MNGHSLLLHTASHLFAKSVSCRSAKFTTGDFECMVRLKKFTLEKSVALQLRRAKTDRSGCCQIAIQGTLLKVHKCCTLVNKTMLEISNLYEQRNCLIRSTGVTVSKNSSVEGKTIDEIGFEMLEW